MKNIVLLLICLGCISCSEKPEHTSKEELKQEIVAVEAAFEAAVKEKGLAQGFMEFAAEDVALLRGKTLILGKDALDSNFSTRGTDFSNISLTWKPDFVDVAKSGDLAYTYGKYVYSVVDSTGNKMVDEGIFHTVWKRQENGDWKFVWD